jgi:predicted thioesterase
MPTDRLTPGLKAEIVTTVDDKLVVRHMGGDGVLSTPSMIALMERASIQAVQDYLPEGHTTVSARCMSSMSEPPQKARR